MTTELPLVRCNAEAMPDWVADGLVRVPDGVHLQLCREGGGLCAALRAYSSVEIEAIVDAAWVGATPPVVALHLAHGYVLRIRGSRELWSTDGQPCWALIGLNGHPARGLHLDDYLESPATAVAGPEPLLAEGSCCLPAALGQDADPECRWAR
jgi:hypothetical protein